MQIGLGEEKATGAKSSGRWSQAMRRGEIKTVRKDHLIRNTSPWPGLLFHFLQGLSLKTEGVTSHPLSFCFPPLCTRNNRGAGRIYHCHSDTQDPCLHPWAQMRFWGCFSPALGFTWGQNPAREVYALWTAHLHCWEGGWSQEVPAVRSGLSGLSFKEGWALEPQKRATPE